MEANLTFCKCQYRGYGERNPHQDKTQSNGKAKMAIPYYWVDLALERLTLSYNEMLRGENTGRDRKKVKKLLYYISESSPKIDFENRGRDAPYETEDGCLSLLCVRKTIDDV